ncbi:MAG: hypothetical protein ACK56F_01220, partial [bacterium]
MWHTKVCEERRYRPQIERPPRQKSTHTRSTLANRPTESQSVQPPTTSSIVIRPYLSRATLRKSRTHSQGVTQVRHRTVIQFQILTSQQLQEITRACHSDKSDSTTVVINLQNHGSHPIRGIEFQRICPNESGRRYEGGFFNDAVMTAYLALLQSSVQPKLKVASTWATLHLLAKGYDEVMRALRYGGTRRQHGNFGDHIWIFFIFNIQQNGKGIHFT